MANNGRAFSGLHKPYALDSQPLEVRHKVRDQLIGGQVGVQRLCHRLPYQLQHMSAFSRIIQVLAKLAFGQHKILWQMFCMDAMNRQPEDCQNMLACL